MKKTKRNFAMTIILALVAGIFPIDVDDSAAKAAEQTQYSGYILSYTREEVKSLDYGMYESAVTDSMHLAYSADGENYQALNYNAGILYAKNEGDKTKVIKQPYIFRMKDGSFGVVAVRMNEAETQADTEGQIIFFTSNDLLSYEEKGMLNLGGSDHAENPACLYDEAKDTYRITWTSAETGITYENITSDFSSVQDRTEADAIVKDAPNTDIPYAIESNVIKVTKEEADKLVNKLLPITNTTVDTLTVDTEPGKAVDLSSLKVTANYSDGSTAEKCVTWSEEDIAKVDFNKEGTYTVSGEIRQLEDKISATGNYPFIPDRADPNMVLFNGKYYFIATNESGNNNFYLKESDTVAGMNDAKDNLIYDEAKGLEGGIISKSNHWAPELHVINGNLYVLFGTNIGTGWDVQSCIMKLSEGGDPTKYEDWEAPQRFLDKDGKVLNTFYGGITLDMTYFTYKDSHFVVWSQRNFGKNGGTADLWIGEIDDENPGQLISEPVLIVNCEYGWERNSNTPVTEGPNAIITDDILYLTYSGGATNETYCLGITQIDLSENVDFLDADSWHKTNYPVLTGFSQQGDKQYHGPGHNSYVTDEDGYLVNVFHARGNDGSKFARDTFIRIVHFSVDGTPVFDMEPETEIHPDNKNVTMVVNVKKKPETVIPTQSPTNETPVITPDSSVNDVKAPAKPKIKSVKQSKGKVIVKWKKVKGAKGYKLEYSTNKSFKKSVKTINTKKIKATVKKLKKGKTYFIRVYSYRTDKTSKKVYGKPSKHVKIKIK